MTHNLGQKFCNKEFEVMSYKAKVTKLFDVVDKFHEITFHVDVAFHVIFYPMSGFYFIA